MTAQLGPNRRTLLKSAGLVVLAGGGTTLLAGCADDTETPNAGQGSSAPDSGSETPAAESHAPETPEGETPEGGASESASADTPDGPTVAKADVPEGGGVIMSDADFVVTQPTAGEYKAFSKICTHQGCPVEEIVSKEIVCPCHQSHFSITDGAAVSGPAQEALPAATVTESGDNLVISA